MATRSTFTGERNVSLYDRDFYEYLKTLDRKDSPARAILEWADTGGAPVTYRWINPRGRWRKRVQDGFLRFSFACFNQWRIYDQVDFWKIIAAMESFLKPEGGATGTAKFSVEGNRPFELRIDYRRKRISVINEGGKTRSAQDLARRTPKIPPRFLAAPGESSDPGGLSERVFEQINLDWLYFGKGRKVTACWRIKVDGAAVTEQSGRDPKRLKTRTKEFGTWRRARLYFYRAIAAQAKKGFSERKR